MRRCAPVLMGSIAFLLAVGVVRALRADDPPRTPISILRSTLTDERASDAEKIKACDEVAARKASVAVSELITLLPRRGALSLHAHEALEAIDPNEVVPQLAGQLSSANLRLRVAAADALAAMTGHADLIVPQMENLFRDGKPDERELACSVLEGLGPAATNALPSLLAALRISDNSIRPPVIAAARAIAPDEDPAVFSYIADLHGGIPDAREAADALNNLGPSLALATPDLLAVSEVQDPYLHTSVTHALDKITKIPPACVPGLIDLAVKKPINGKPPLASVRPKAIRSLAEIQPHAFVVIEMLVELLPDDEVGDTAAQTLMAIHFSNENIVKRIGTMLTRSLPVRRRAAVALQGSTRFSVAVLDTLKEALADDDMSVRRDVSLVICGIGPSAKSAIPALESVLRRGDESSPAAAMALGAIGTSAKSAAPVLVEALRAEPVSRPIEGEWDISARIRSACAAAIGRIDPNSDATRDLLIQAVRQKDWVVREALTGAMADLQTRDHFIAALQTLATDHDELVRINARCALRELSGPPSPATQPGKTSDSSRGKL